MATDDISMTPIHVDSPPAEPSTENIVKIKKLQSEEAETSVVIAVRRADAKIRS